MKNHGFTISEAINTGRNATKKYFWILMLLGGIVYIPSLVSNFFSLMINYIPGATEMITDPATQIATGQPTATRSMILVVVLVIATLLGARLGIGLIKTYLMILEDKKPTVKDLCIPFRYVLRLIGGGLLVGLMVILGCIALIIPGIYLAIRFSMFKYFITEGYGAIDAIKASWAATQGNVGNLVGISFVYFCVILLGLLALVFGLLWAVPTVALAQAYVYTQLKKNLPDTFKPLH